MWRFGPGGERTLCNACGVRQGRIEAKVVKDKKRSDDIARKAAYTAKRLAACGDKPVKPRTWIRPSRSKAAIAARERALCEESEYPWPLEKWDYGEYGDHEDDEDDIVMCSCRESNAPQNDIDLYFKCCEGGEMYGDGWYVREELQNMDDLCDSGDIDDYVDMDDIGDFYDVDDMHDEIEKIRTNAPLSPRSPFAVTI